MKSVIPALSAVLLAGLALSGCGQKGALFLPGHNPNPPEPLIQPADQKHKPTGSNDDHRAAGESGQAEKSGPAANGG